jgi:hypothetical protein
VLVSKYRVMQSRRIFRVVVVEPEGLMFSPSLMLMRSRTGESLWIGQDRPDNTFRS